MVIPAVVQVAPDCFMPVIQQSLHGPLGCVDLRGEAAVIRIEIDQPDPGKLLTLLHELMHVAEIACLQAKIFGWKYRVLRWLVGECFIQHISCLLFQYMAAANMLTGCTAADALAFCETSLVPPPGYEEPPKS